MPASRVGPVEQSIFGGQWARRSRAWIVLSPSMAFEMAGEVRLAREFLDALVAAPGARWVDGLSGNDGMK
jgi:hypothetical protein